MDSIVLVLGLVPLIIAICIIYRAWQYLNIGTAKTKNNNNFAIENFKSLLKEAEEKISIYDDGNKMSESIYENEELIEMVKQKLEDNNSFTMQCSFNTDDPTLFREKFESHDQVSIKIREKPIQDLAHYKIIDDGKKAYLSWHAYGDENRSVKTFDFSKVKQWPGQKDVKEGCIGEYLRDIENQFATPYSS